MLAVSLLAAGVGCSKTPGSSNKDGGTDLKADVPMSEAGNPDAPAMCTDDGTKNKDNGLACTCSAQCKSGFCVDGVCCDKACTGTCLTCALATGPVGTCTMIPAGVHPRNVTDCVATDPSGCGLDGLCDGTGSCERYPAGSECSAGACDGDTVSGRYQCDGAGNCKAAASTVCAPFSCDPSTKKCFDTCTVDGDCAQGQQCVKGSCGPKMIAAACKSDSECASGHCNDGVCCNVDCSRECRTCALVGHVGTCSPTPQGHSHPLCGVQSQTTCGTTGLCDGFGSCSKWPANTICGPSKCDGDTVDTAQTCDGLGTCRPPDVNLCAPYQCTDGACTSSCTPATQTMDCIAGIACQNESCGPKQDGQSCKADSECQNGHCVDEVCCDTTCTGACRSCALPDTKGTCTYVADGAADPRGMCSDLGASACATDGKCAGDGSCRKYPVGTVCAGEDCTNDVYTGPSTCNASGQCIKPTSMPCNPYTCNANKCFGACTTDKQCIPPNTCGQNGKANSCGPKSGGADCSTNDECGSGHCAQGKCCDTACTGACTACNLAGSEGTCTDVQSGADPQGICMAQAQNTCGTTGMCSAGHCALYASGTVCKAASCELGGPPSPALTPPSTCDGAGKCVTPSDVGCAPGRCDPTALMCLNTCTTNADCTNPNTCQGGSCGLIQKGGPCTTTNQCVSGLTCNHDKVCCDQTCDGVCETCKPGGTCTAVSAGQADPSGMCQVTASTSCGTNGKCTGNSSAAGTARCQDWDSSNSCQSQSCANTGANGAGMLTAQAYCGAGPNAGMCFVPTATACGGGVYKCLDATQCRTSCNSDADCAGVTCNTVTHVCGTKQAQGAMCNSAADCVSTAANCVDGVCCDTACAGACVACNLSMKTGTCSAVTSGTSDPLCPAASGMSCGNTGLCASGGACAKKTGTVCQTATCSMDGLSSIPAAMCNGTDTCPTPTPVACAPASCSGSGMTYSQTTAAMCTAGACGSGTTTSCGTFTCNAAGTACKTACAADTDCANGKACDTVAGTCTLTPVGQACTVNAQCKGGNCVDGFCCNTACTATCMACSMARTGGANGTCANIASNGADSRCTAAPPCGNDGTCNGSGACKKPAAGTIPASGCPAASCTNDMLTPASACDGMGACTTPTASPCAKNLSCFDLTTCNTSCTSAAQCATGFMTCNPDGSCSL